jgi:hypothetical protein
VNKNNNQEMGASLRRRFPFLTGRDIGVAISQYG